LLRAGEPGGNDPEDEARASRDPRAGKEEIRVPVQRIPGLMTYERERSLSHRNAASSRPASTAPVTAEMTWNMSRTDVGSGYLRPRSVVQRRNIACEDGASGMYPCIARSGYFRAQCRNGP